MGKCGGGSVDVELRMVECEWGSVDGGCGVWMRV